MDFQAPNGIALYALNILLVAEYSVNKIFVINLETNMTSVLCLGDWGHKDDTLRCVFEKPGALSMVNGALYVTAKGRIIKVEGLCLK